MRSSCQLIVRCVRPSTAPCYTPSTVPAGKPRDSGTLRQMSKLEVFQSMPASVPRVEQNVAAKVKRATLGTPARHGRPECRKLVDKLLDTQASSTPPHVGAAVLRAPCFRRYRHWGTSLWR